MSRTSSLEEVVEREMATESRYQRQADLLQNEGWDQTKLANSNVAVLGSGVLADYAVLTLASFGFGNILLYEQGIADQEMRQNHQRRGDPDFSRGFLTYEVRLRESKAKAVENLIRKINPEINFRGINIGMQRQENHSLMEKPDILIDATNDPASKISAIDYAIQNNIPVVSMSAGKFKGGIGVFDPRAGRDDQRKMIENLLFYEHRDEKQDPSVSLVIGGIGIEEARKIINPMQNEKVIDDLVVYNQLSDTRFDHEQNKTIDGSVDLKDYSILMIGAGALGNFVGLGLSLRNVGKLTVVDFDTVEVTNLNRQILFYDAVGREKASALVEKLRMINPRGNYTARFEKITPESEEFFRRNKFDLIIDTVDNNETRALLNYYSIKYKIPFISGGTRYNSGQSNICVPGESGCLNCQADIDNLALGNYRRQQENHSCIYAAQPSVITSNQITAGLMIGEIPSVLDKESCGNFAKGEIKFVSNEDQRLALLPPAVQVCDCCKNEELIEKWHEKMKGVYD